ncbi:YheC/YheD family protein [Priestia megaterium]
MLLHQTVYLKPKNGSLGRGIYTLSFKDSMYTLTYKGEKGLHVQEKETLEDLLSEFEYLLTNPSYIAQQGISLIKKKSAV